MPPFRSAEGGAARETRGRSGVRSENREGLGALEHDPRAAAGEDKAQHVFHHLAPAQDRVVQIRVGPAAVVLRHEADKLRVAKTPVHFLAKLPRGARTGKKLEPGAEHGVTHEVWSGFFKRKPASVAGLTEI